ncbi:acetyl-CoA C-acyltransferase family protein [Stappia taiwanensis]|uniref:Beta-ketothiolase n=1 Tax=Stappia taiwanensis TaxID=992267 RepID=A0A838XQK6_9HYPH|nr:acetyl-CoA C-acyltransferase family protein [Stappia taiwanensis]MBA4610988.1 acetyl-CoA C-acyltransferase family protein [Stappia taiwanensis]GGE94243.1 acetyl-CoA acetyltransferase [Stappia taiwanensis]
MTQREVVLVSGVRTAIGSFGGSLKSVPPCELAGKVTAEAIRRSGVGAEEIEHVVFGHVINTEPRDMYLARVAAVDAGIPVEAPALTLNRLCGSGAQAIVSGAQSILLGDADITLAGGAESMSRAPFSSPGARFGVKMGDAVMHDMMLGALNDPFGGGHMGITAENVAERYNISREAQDALAVDSQHRAGIAIRDGRFSEQILPLDVKVGRNTIKFDTDEHVRADTSPSTLSALRPVFRKDGSVTAGNSSGLNDGAAAVVLADRETAERRGLRPMARLIGYAHAGVAPDVMGIGPIPAVQKLLEKTGMSPADFDVIESNEAFAAQACAVMRELGFPSDRVNPNGGAIALGHPVGATGCIITVKTMYELERTGGRYGLVTMCIGGGQGIALALENLSAA